jgi:5-methylcytosine-specific restriction endonuclease McrA
MSETQNTNTNLAAWYENRNPGEDLRDLIKELCPIDLDEEASSLTALDSFIKADGRLAETIYESTINYLTRRLINTAEYLRRRYESDNFPEGAYVEKLRDYLQNQTGIPPSKLEKALILILLCVNIKKQNRKMEKQKRKSFINEYLRSNSDLRCYMCGRSLAENEAEIEHVWPKSMGGLERNFNLRISCHECNNVKLSYVDSSDFHYEHISLVNDESMHTFANEFKRQYKIAVWAKSEFQCSLCRRTASEIGRLGFTKINPEDSWHFLNIDAICENCRKGNI